MYAACNHAAHHSSIHLTTHVNHKMTRFLFSVHTGRAYFKSCPNDSASCSAVEAVQGDVGGSVELDTRVDFRYGGECGFKQNIRIMRLQRVQPLYYCSNLGTFSESSCEDSERVSVSTQGAEKYDIELSLNGLTLADAGTYTVAVDLDSDGHKRTSIVKHFELAISGWCIIILLRVHVFLDGPFLVT